MTARFRGAYMHTRSLKRTSVELMPVLDNRINENLQRRNGSRALPRYIGGSGWAPGPIETDPQRDEARVERVDARFSCRQHYDPVE